MYRRPRHTIVTRTCCFATRLREALGDARPPPLPPRTAGLRGLPGSPAGRRRGRVHRLSAPPAVVARAPLSALRAPAARQGCPAAGAGFDRAWAPLAYEGAARDLVAALKFRAALRSRGSWRRTSPRTCPPTCAGDLGRIRARGRRVRRRAPLARRRAGARAPRPPPAPGVRRRRAARRGAGGPHRAAARAVPAARSIGAGARSGPAGCSGAAPGASRRCWRRRRRGRRCSSTTSTPPARRWTPARGR